MDDPLETLRNFVETILNEDSDFAAFQQPVMHYGLFLRNILNSQRADFMRQRNINAPTKTAAGDALNAWHAAACMEDRTRTAAFVRGSIRAVERALEQSSRRPLHLVEAGCGPMGTLALPLLAHFDSQELEISLIDLHEESIDCIRSMLDHFDFLSRVRQLECGDACAIEIESPVDVILTETMNAALSQEPQVAISQALIRQHPTAMLVPQSIRVDCVLLNFAAETSHFPPQPGERQGLGTVFELNCTSALELKENAGQLPAARINLPSDIKNGFSPWLTTTVQVFEDSQISDYETQITSPVPLSTQSGQPLAAGTALAFAYQLGHTPGIVFNVVQPNAKHDWDV